MNLLPILDFARKGLFLLCFGLERSWLKSRSSVKFQYFIDLALKLSIVKLNAA